MTTQVSALEIENILMENQDLQECCIVGVHDDVWGQKVAAVVVPAAGKACSSRGKRAIHWAS
jgi:malonyl-CoA/methylmalonyl-CoA synthetase